MYIVTIWSYIRYIRIFNDFNAIILDHSFLIFSVLNYASLNNSISRIID